MPGFADINGQRDAVEELKAALDSGRIVHAYLFAGPRGVGKGLAARVFARALICETENNRPCDTCLACQKAINLNHPDIIYLKPEGASLKIEQVRELQHAAYAKSYLGGYKIFVLEDIHKATAQAFNSLLKILEEPPPQRVFVLITDNPRVLPATIVSRCQRINFKPLESEENENSRLDLTRQLAADFIRGAFSKSYYHRYKVIEVLEKEKVEPASFLEQILLILRQAYFEVAEGRGSELTAGNHKVDERILQRALQKVLEACQYQRRQANTKLLLDVLGCRLAGLA